MTVPLGYYSTTRPTSMAAAIDGTATVIQVLDGVTYPDPVVVGKPYTIILGYGSDREEVVTVLTKPTPTSFTVTRAQDGTPATSKNAGDIVVHGVSARDFRRIDVVDSEMDVVQADITALKAADTALQTGKLARDGSQPMIGPLPLVGNPTLPLHAAPMQYVLPKDGSAPMTGPLTLPGDPTLPLQAAPKQYVDLHLKRDGSETMTGPLLLPGDPTLPLHATPKQYVDKRIHQDGSVPMTGNLDARGMKVGLVWDGGWKGVQDGTVAPNGTGGPTVMLRSADGRVFIVGSGAGGTVTIRPGPATDASNDLTISSSGVSLPGAPTSGLHAATKDYVDKAAWVKMSRGAAMAIPANDWTQMTSISLDMPPGHGITGGSTILVPAGVYVVTARATPNNAGRFVFAITTGGVAVGSTGSFFFDIRNASADSWYSGARTLYVTSTGLELWAYSTVATTVNFFVEATRVASENAT